MRYYCQDMRYYCHFTKRYIRFTICDWSFINFTLQMSIYDHKINTYTIYSPWSRSKLILPYDLSTIAYASFQSQNTYIHDVQYMIGIKETNLDITLQIVYNSICFTSIRCLFFCGNQMFMVLFKIHSIVQRMSTNIEAYTNLFLYAEKTRWNGDFSKGFCSPLPLYIYIHICID